MKVGDAVKFIDWFVQTHPLSKSEYGVCIQNAGEE